ncbi:hypothetical protein CJ195_18420 [Bacillus sp. UMB0899]|nr:hypothetical protein CJ195_18420 [Bacillus sp. UMB0899]
MGKKRSGHYCFGCDRYRANEKFSGKGHRQHICKDCKSKGKGKKTFPDKKPQYNRFIKLLKVTCVVFKEKNEYLFFSIHGQIYMIRNLEEQLSHELIFIYKYSKDHSPSITLTDVWSDNLDDIIEALLIKTDYKFDVGINIENDGYMVNDMFGYEPTVRELRYLRLIPEIEDVIQKQLQEEVDHLVNVMFGYL